MTRYHNINGNRVKFTAEEETARDLEEAEWKKEYDATQYKRDRSTQFPELKEQLDLLFHDMTAGKGTKDGEWYKVVAKVKSDNPKPE